MADQKALLVLNGELDLNKEEIKELIKSNQINYIIAVDGGADKLKDSAINPNLIIGDLDSISVKTKEFFAKQGVEIKKYPVEKDQTDSELAVDYCLDKALNEVFLIAALGGRIDQELANLNLLEYISSNQLKAKIIAKNIEIALITDSKKFKEKENYRLSLIPQTKTVENVSIQGCKYNLENKNLFRHKTRGISNLITEKEAEVSLQKGSLLYILEKLK
ncbi:thiamine diphosphokinase [Halanaerobium sp. Z-7514]|uniref:Thiamine diphosphokinase n=1 Tax=Halanaerobium polyolivorans TaxID=2886943 RepID=A0AAW4X038_9FIRM|nr:thiamine diphosphokinase [Halanaerobium polyolivorans]MCC3144781.1 thiamine diphosphokinase [Halanaerobium polyolivorans]RQD70217.1 MAG: thiamine diphosphokinase [Halanaerobium sp. MSAO_Bac5]